MSLLDQGVSVSFVPMEAVSNDDTGEYVATDRLLREVAKGYTSFADGDILWAKITPSMQNGKACIVDGLSNGIGFGSTEFHILRVNDPSVSRAFVFELISQPMVRSMAVRAFTGSAGQQRVPAAFLERLPFPQIPHERQREIVETMEAARRERLKELAEADALLAGLDSCVFRALDIKASPENRRSVFGIKSRALKQRLDSYFYSSVHAQVADMLAQTRCEPLGAIAMFSDETWEPSNHIEPTFRYIEISRVDPKTGLAEWSSVPLDEAPSRARMKIRTDDIIISLTRPHHGSIAHLGSDFDGCIASTGFAVIRDVAAHVRRDYLWCLLRTQLCLRQMMQRSSGGNYPAITPEELGEHGGTRA